MNLLLIAQIIQDGYADSYENHQFVSLSDRYKEVLAYVMKATKGQNNPEQIMILIKMETSIANAGLVQC